jgi:hypothetical protein
VVIVEVIDPELRRRRDPIAEHGDELLLELLGRQV